jgi:hypothetical protein
MHSWGRQVIHVFDRGFAGSPWLGECLELRLRFILRWTKTFLLRDSAGTTGNAWHITRGKRSWGQRQVWDARRQQWFQAGVLAVPVRHPDYATPLWLVVSRPGKGHLPWYLLTEDTIETEEDAWQVVFASARRWLLRYCCHRTGKRCRQAAAPLSRLPWAISRLWLTYAPSPFFSRLLNSG